MTSNTTPTQRMNFSLMQNVLLVWLDSYIDDHDADCRNSLTQLHDIVHSISTHTDPDQCLQFLQRIKNETVCMIISGSLGQLVVPRLHYMAQVDSIFIFCGNKQRHEEWVKEWPKIKGVFTDILPICKALEKVTQECEQDATPISFMATTHDISHKKLDQLEPLFMYSQILKEIILSITFENKHFRQFIQYYHKALADNDEEVKLNKELKFVKELETHYHEKTPIYWYTYPCFLYTMLNRALRLMDADTIIHMGFFINDLHHHIEKLHQEQFPADRPHGTFTVYRGQGLSETQFKQLSETKGGLLSFNSFLSTSKNRKTSSGFANRAMRKPDTVGVLFIMTIEPSKSTTPFASINEASYFKHKEDEVLLSMHTVFRIGEIRTSSENARLFEVELTLTNDDDKDLRELTDRIRIETSSSDSGWLQFCDLLLKIGQSRKAQEMYEILLEEPTHADNRARIYHGLGKANDDQACYKESANSYEKSLAILQQSLPPNHPSLASSYNNIGLVYSNMGDYAKALSCHERALAIEQQSLSPNHPDLATSYDNIGSVYCKMGDYAKAISSHERALAIEQQSLPLNHPDLATSHNNIGLAHFKMGDYAKALSCHEKALAIFQQSLPPNHPDLATSYNSIGSVYSNMGDYAKALSSFEKALAIRQQSLPPSHPDLATSYNVIGLVYFKMGDYAKTLSSYEKALAIRQQSLPLKHPALANSYNNIGLVYFKMGDYAKALSSFEEALVIEQQSLPSNHPDLATSYNNIGLVYDNMGDYAKTLLFYEKALTILQQSLPLNHPSLASSYNNIGLVYSNMGDYAKALSCHERALAIEQQSLSPNHPDLATSYNSIGSVYSNIGDYAKALSSFEKALAIRQQSLPSNHPDLATSYNNIGSVYANMSDYAKAVSSFEKALAIKQQSLPSNHPSLAASYNNIGSVYGYLGDYAKALSFSERAVKILREVLPSNHPNLQRCQRNLDEIKKKL